MRYSVQPRNETFVKGYRFLSSLKKMGKNIGTNISKSEAVNITRDFLIILKNLQKIRLKLLQKEQFKNS